MTEQYIRYAAMFIIIMMAVIDDYRRFKVSNRIIIAGMVIGVVINMGSLMYGGDVRGYIYGGMAGFAIMYMVYIFGGVGAGDVKLLAVCGLLIGDSEGAVVGAYQQRLGLVVGDAAYA